MSNEAGNRGYDENAGSHGANPNDQKDRKAESHVPYRHQASSAKPWGEHLRDPGIAKLPGDAESSRTYHGGEYEGNDDGAAGNDEF